jgi:hypothetical protein
MSDNLLNSYRDDLKERLEKYPVSKCENCTYAKFYDDSKLEKLLKQKDQVQRCIDLVDQYNDEQMNLSWKERGSYRPNYLNYVQMNDVISRIDTIENCILCQRFPESVKKRRDDKCGEYRKKK